MEIKITFNLDENKISKCYAFLNKRNPISKYVDYLATIQKYLNK
jgi:hypothetical protein